MALKTGDATRMPHAEPRRPTKSFWRTPNVVLTGMVLAIAVLLSVAVTNSWDVFTLGSQPAVEKVN